MIHVFIYSSSVLQTITTPLEGDNGVGIKKSCTVLTTYYRFHIRKSTNKLIIKNLVLFIPLSSRRDQ